jgi:hypothetical protein
VHSFAVSRVQVRWMPSAIPLDAWQPRPISGQNNGAAGGKPGLSNVNAFMTRGE